MKKLFTSVFNCTLIMGLSLFLLNSCNNDPYFDKEALETKTQIEASNAEINSIFAAFVRIENHQIVLILASKTLLD